MQIIMKIISREPPPGKKIPLTIEDSLFWVDWVVTAAVALSLSLLSSSKHHEQASAAGVGGASGGTADDTDKLIGLFFVFGGGMLLLPLLIRYFCYDGTGKIKGWPYVILTNAAGVTVLLVAVTTGVNIYGSS
ncbi:hypothetical protein ACWD25_52185 [Streptomyces sp. NPDC002920]